MSAFSVSIFSRWTWISQCLLKQRMMEMVVTTGAVSRAKFIAHQQTNTKLYRPDAIPIAQPTVSEHWREKMQGWQSHIHTHIHKGKGKRKRIYIAPLLKYLTLEALRYGSHSVTCKLHRTCLYLISIHQMAHPRLRLRTSNCSLLLIYLPRKDERLSWPGWLVT